MSGSAENHSHPLDPLTEQEIESAAATVRASAGLDASAFFESIMLWEPSKLDLAADTAPKRLAFVACYEPSSNRTFDGLVEVAAGELVRWDHRPGMQARIAADEYKWAAEIARADADVQAAFARRGIDDPDKVLIEVWTAGNYGVAEEDSKRLGYCHCWLGNEAGDMPYARHIANLHPVVDLRAGKVLRVDDFGVVALPPDPGPMLTRPPRGDLKPLDIRQDEGPSFTVEGHQVRWQNWRIRLGFNVREGLTLHDIGYEDGGRVRPIMHRASVCEMVIPYGDPRPGAFRRNAFDTGENGIGPFLEELSLGCDCLGLIRYFDVISHDWQGKAKPIANAICMHEEDFGILWKYPTWITGNPMVARSRRLVISSIASVGNYVYGFFWYFYQDGTIGTEVKATGVPCPSAIAPGEASEWGRVIGPGIDAHVHLHSFSYRFDMAVDGPQNAVREVNFEALPAGPDNPMGNACRSVETALESEQAARRNMSLDTARSWKIVNPGKHNALGQPVGYRLAPGTNAMPFVAADAPVARRAGYMFNHFWATPYAPEELHAAGWYPNQHAGGDGLPKWTRGDRALEGESVVVWYTLNYHHVPRPEDWPVQPVAYAGLHWMADGFFDENPAMDVPLGAKA
jgi:primary-amine oxidase